MSKSLEKAWAIDDPNLAEAVRSETVHSTQFRGPRLNSQLLQAVI